MRKILILTASFGDGHNAAARSVRQALELAEPEASVEVLDLFDSTYGRLNRFFMKAYRGVVRYAPALWSRLYSGFDNPALFQRQLRRLGKLREAMGVLLQQKQPDVIVSTYPVYSHLIAALFGEELNRPFRLITVITDSISVCSAWYLAPGDFFVVADELTAEVLRQGGVAAEQIKTLGFPVSPAFARERPAPLARPGTGQPPKVLYVINTGKPLAGRSLDQLLRIKGLQLTITTGRSAPLKTKLERRLRDFGQRVRVYGWTDEMPELLMSHHLLIGKAGGALVHEAMAARCPMIINQVIPGQEEGNARLVETLGGGAVAAKQDFANLVKQAFDGNARLWQQWRNNLERASQPDSALRVADLILSQFPPAPHECGVRPAPCSPKTGKGLRSFRRPPPEQEARALARVLAGALRLYCAAEQVAWAPKSSRAELVWLRS